MSAEQEEPSNLVILEEIRAEREPSHEIVIALAPELYAFLPERERRVRRRGRAARVRFVPANAVPAGLVPDLVIGDYTPTAPGLRMLCQTVGHLYEIDQTHRVFKDAELIWSEPLSAIGAPRSWLPGQFVIGEEAALLFVSREDEGWHLRIFVTDDRVAWFTVPALRRPRVPLRNWLDLALHALKRARIAS